MSPLRKPRSDLRWERTPGTGLILPRYPSRERYIQQMGTAQCCCDVDEYTVDCCEGITTAPRYLAMAVTGLPSCAYLTDGTYVAEYAGGNTCRWDYGTLYAIDSISFSLCGSFGACGNAFPAVVFGLDNGETCQVDGYVSGPATGPATWTSSTPRVIGGTDCFTGGGTACINVGCDLTGVEVSLYVP